MSEGKIERGKVRKDDQSHHFPMLLARLVSVELVTRSPMLPRELVPGNGCREVGFEEYGCGGCCECTCSCYCC